MTSNLFDRNVSREPKGGKIMFFKKVPQSPQYFLPDAAHDSENVQQSFLAQELAREITCRKARSATLITLCIGTDKITGDCLGPLVGTKLLERGYRHPVHGTLQHPVHAVNLLSTISALQENYAHPFLLVIDAAVGPAEKIGCISLSRAPISPGKGICRPLPPVGNLSLTGIVGEASEHCAADLPYTRLFVVNTLADFICGAVLATEKLLAK